TNPTRDRLPRGHRHDLEGRTAPVSAGAPGCDGPQVRDDSHRLPGPPVKEAHGHAQAQRGAIDPPHPERSQVCQQGPSADRSDGVIFARTLRRYRIAAGLSQRELARKASLSMTDVWKYEEAFVEPKLGSILRLCSALGVTPNDLLLPKEDKAACS